MTKLSQSSVLVLACFVAAGCGRVETSQNEFTSSEDVGKLPEELRAPVRLELLNHTGTFDSPILLTNDGSVSKSRLKTGQQVYQKRCVQCHGVNGDGNGPVAESMYPRPRDYRKGVFKFTSTPYGSKPQREDLVRTVRNGVSGTSMPSFKLLPEDDIQAVIDYVMMLTNRGELEEQLAYIADVDGELIVEDVEDSIIPSVKRKWEQAEGSQIVPYTSQPVFTADHVTRGEQAFLTKDCWKCHGKDGRGQTPENLAGNLKDAWGHVTRAADLTSGMLHGGQQPIDIYRRIYSGINGTPMPGFANAFKDEPDTIWDLVAYVQHLSNSRRLGERHLPGPISPYVPRVEESDTGAE